jgi:transposase
MAHSLDLRQRIVDAHQTGKLSVRRIAEIYQVGIGTVKELSRLYRETGSLVPRMPAPLPIWTDPNLHQVARDLVNDDNDATLAEYCDRFTEQTGMRISVPQMCTLLIRLKLYRKKKTLRASEGECERVEQARQEWNERIEGIDPNRLVFLDETMLIRLTSPPRTEGALNSASGAVNRISMDETGVNLGMTRRYARAEGEARAHGSAPKNHGKNETIVGSIRINGEMTALHFPGSLNGEAFHTYTEKILCPHLTASSIVVMDNLRAHQNKRAIAAIEATGAKIWFLPPYSPKLNPIEECWSKIKTILRTIAARTREALGEGITQALNAVTPSDAHGWYEHSGYVAASG